MQRSSDLWEAMARWAERKADKAASSDAPWALANLRVYQNCASRYWSECYKAKREEEQCKH